MSDPTHNAALTFPRAERDALRALYDKATPGEWVRKPFKYDESGCIRVKGVESLVALARFGSDFDNDKTVENADLIAAAHNALPRLLAALDAAEARADTADAALKLLAHDANTLEATRVKLAEMLAAAEVKNARLRAGLAELAAQAREDLADLHECDACEGMRSDQDELRNPAGDDRPCPQCGGTGRYDERAPLARAVLRLADESETTRQPEAAP